MSYEAGKTYKTQRGEKATIVFRVPEPSANEGRLVGYVATKNGNTIYNWQDDGKAGMGPVGTNPYDLVGEWTEKDAA